MNTFNKKIRDITFLLLKTFHENVNSGKTARQIWQLVMWSGKGRGIAGRLKTKELS